MSVIQSVEDQDIFINPNSLTNLIKGKKLLDNGIKVEINKIKVPVVMQFTATRISFVFHRPSTIEKTVMNEIVDSLSDIVWKRYDCGHYYMWIVRTQ
ncbi:hypothetical protein [Bacillus atrophaeus]|uniref:Uncharacterized protein n=1 Tax=Bacillus atrophaeus (strain 1942) TaxID=720555 RepID=A0ABM5LX04_BACA1|nr:hypothetical protein [Bacillus atrophaeus]AMR62681.1 hypothetical protein A1D11_09805 [Bacillus subtilis subsp. globigii]ADP32459.1 hypothetical protein BATR1942_07600 [Bacillus atrophaeus 1942]AIK48519.1 hypothetical protein DJ95_1419 [Bacillus atrophaeus subsp. globigii]EIM11741.1 hypothetical protein UY9_05762 [Bacillus atrophaeus C89]KFK83426.1 hypothetical protein DK44_2217 [Bacillus atrophaeus]